MNQESFMSLFQHFLMERFMSEFEQQAAYNLLESCVCPIRLAELLVEDLEIKRQ